MSEIVPTEASRLIGSGSGNGGGTFSAPVDHEVAQLQPEPRLLLRLWLRAFPLGFRAEFLEMLALAWPSILTTLLQFLLQTTSFIMCGHMTKEDLDGVALGNSLINVAGMSIGVGMSTACDTLFSQTYGSRNRKRIGLYLQRSFLLMNCALLVLACLHLNIRPVLLLMQQVPDIAHRAAWYMRLFLPGLFFQFNFLVLSRYLQNQSRMNPPMLAAFVGNVFNAVSQYVAIHVLGYGFLASSVCQAASLGLMFALTLGYILISGVYKETWDGWKVASLYDWGGFVKLSVPGIFLIALEEWSFEICTIIAGTLGTVQLGAQSIIFQLESISYMIPFGMSVAVNIRVGQQLGGMQAAGAAQSFRVGMLMIIAVALVTCNLFVFLRQYLPRIFTSDGEIVSTAADVIPLLGLFQLLDGISAVSCGAIRGTGRQVEGAVLLFIGYYIIGLPIGIPLALLTGLEVTGTWIGLLVGIAAEAVAFSALVMRFNWAREVEKAQARAYGSGWRKQHRRRRRRQWEERRRKEDGESSSGEDDDDDDDDDDDVDEEDGSGDLRRSQPALLSESENAPLFGGSGGFDVGYGGVDNNGDDASVAVAVIAVDDLPRPEPDEIAFYSDPETFHDAAASVSPPPPPLPPQLQSTTTTTTATSTATATTSTATTSTARTTPTAATSRSSRSSKVVEATPVSRHRRRRSVGAVPGRGGGGGRIRRGRRQQQQHQSPWAGDNLLYTGRFYGSSRLLFSRPVGDTEEDDDEDEGQTPPPALRPLLAKRLALLLVLAACLAGAFVLMLFTDAYLDRAESNGTSARNVTPALLVSTTGFAPWTPPPAR